MSARRFIQTTLVAAIACCGVRHLGGGGVRHHPRHLGGHRRDQRDASGLRVRPGRFRSWCPGEHHQRPRYRSVRTHGRGRGRSRRPLGLQPGHRHHHRIRSRCNGRRHANRDPERIGHAADAAHRHLDRRHRAPVRPQRRQHGRQRVRVRPRGAWQRGPNRQHHREQDDDGLPVRRGHRSRRAHLRREPRRGLSRRVRRWGHRQCGSADPDRRHQYHHPEPVRGGARRRRGRVRGQQHVAGGGRVQEGRHR